MAYEEGGEKSEPTSALLWVVAYFRAALIAIRSAH
jgi:hypothetical protein